MLLHILVVPFQSEGHVNCMLRLARYLAAREDVMVTFAYPARFHHLSLKRNSSNNNIPTISAAAPSSASSSRLRIEVVDDGLPLEDDQSLNPIIVVSSIPIFRHSVQLLLDDLLSRAAAPEASSPAALNQQQQDFHHLPPPSCVISDTFVPWTQDLADAAHLPRVDFWTSTAAVYSMGSQLPLMVSKGILPLSKSSWVDVETKWTAKAPLIECVPGLPAFPVTDLPWEFVRPEEVADIDLQFMLTAFSRVKEANTILVHSLYELERPIFDALCAAGLPIHAAGPLPESSSRPILPPSSSSKHDCLRWLDTQRPASVIYVALGSIAKLKPAEMHAMALGLEASKSPFLWVVRPDFMDRSQVLADALPPGFLHRTVDQGAALIVPWAPQTQVLAHCSVGAFLSHCGWNSTVESMLEGVPMVACPRAAEQRSNAKWVVETWKMGVALQREEDGSFTQEAVERAVREVLSAKDGVDDYYKQKALHLKEVARHAFEEGGSSRANLDLFLQGLRSPNLIN